MPTTTSPPGVRPDVGPTGTPAIAPIVARVPAGRHVTVDLHQHLWPESFVEALRRRRTAPRLDGWTLHLDGEPPYAVDPADHDAVPGRRQQKIAVPGNRRPRSGDHWPHTSSRSSGHSGSTSRSSTSPAPTTSATRSPRVRWC